MGTELDQITVKVSNFITLIKNKYPLKAAYLFGSWAVSRNTRGSDVDIGIIVDDALSRESRFDIFSMGKDFDPDFDVVVCPEKDFLSEDPLVIHEMKTKGIRLA
jgi:predicted nucleotidyltransferase